MKEKRCQKCDELKSVKEFWKNKRRKDGFHNWCKSCGKKQNSTYSKLNRSKLQTYKRKWNREHPEYLRKVNLKKYGLSLEQYDEIFEVQDGVCAICGGINKDGRRLMVDHNHSDNRVRGLLCSNCNTALGLLGDSVEIFLSAAMYLERTNG